MKRILIAAFTVSAFTWASCSSDNNTNQQETADTEAATTTDEQSATVAGTDSTLTEDQEQLMQTIAQHSLLQVELGKLAAAKGTTDDVKQYGQEMVQAYTTQLNELQKVAQTYHKDLNVTLGDDYRKYAEDLGKKQGVDFDKEYWKNITDAQKKALDDYDDHLKKITEADATAFGTWARTSGKELRARYEQALAQEQQLDNRL
ncbi:DUF4142 domain-containing protein [Pontibacter sp. Tf4]|uniref:DUF4142 domain-containing protein n=1 Tax=Pontibacter sp. Tf4 TaxID=2761620 RepID=UPI001628D692|nr:DUF4142 domain-containing protein [Pontibacter sp. Tf4]MBB6610882.1 DUF4142 domain-containing protein [Pontibacter sp. Tf4]